MSPREAHKIKNFIQTHKGGPFICIEVIKTEGSTYRKNGAIKIVTPKGDSVGLISGGCLEAEIIEKALAMTTTTATHIFDTRSETDRLFGYAIGCQGQLTLEYTFFEETKTLFDKLASSLESNLKIHVVGIGPDMDPLKELLNWLAWDHCFYSLETDRLALREKEGWPVLNLDQLLNCIQRPKREAVLLMSHNYNTDLDILSNVSELGLAYVGILGPGQRKQKMLSDLKSVYQKEWPESQIHHLHGPIGLDGMGRGETAIALSVVADLQRQFFTEKDSL